MQSNAALATCQNTNVGNVRRADLADPLRKGHFWKTANVGSEPEPDVFFEILCDAVHLKINFSRVEKFFECL